VGENLEIISNKNVEIKGHSSLTDDANTFDKLYHGEWQSKYPSQSEADFALCCKLAFWANHDLAQMDRVFCASALFWEKWDAQHGVGGDTYGQITLRNACEKTKDTYTPPKRKRKISIYESSGTYFRKRSDEVKQLINFIVRPIESVTSDESVAA